VKVYFAVPGESFGEFADDGVSPLPSFGWNAYEKQQFMLALNEYTKITGLQYAETTNSADAEFRVITTTSTQYGAYFYPWIGLRPSRIGAFNVLSGGWNLPGQDSPEGGFSFGVMRTGATPRFPSARPWRRLEIMLGDRGAGRFGI
jgi:hypothetical protein